MARTGRGNGDGRRNCRNGKNPRKNLDRDDDYPMHDITPSSNQRGVWKNSNPNNTRNNNGKENWGNRNSKNRNPFDRFADPFDDMESLRFRGGQQGPRGRGNPPNRNPNNNGGNRRGPSNATNYPNNNPFRNNPPHNNNNPFPPSSSAPRGGGGGPSGPGLPRFCPECSRVRRANLRLRDWFASAIQCACEVLNSWSDEVGVGRGSGYEVGVGWGSGDEMDWQPEPVVQVVIVTTDINGNPALAPPMTGGWPQDQQQPNLFMGDPASFLRPNVNYNAGPWGLRPGNLFDPGFMGGGNTGGNASNWMISPPDTPMIT